MGSLYEQLGASSEKSDVHRATQNLDAGEFPTAFCRLGPDILGNDPDWVSAAHADGAGTKAILAYLHFKETNDVAVFRGIAQDALVMNLDDLICVGAVDRFLLANTIGRNAARIPGAVLKEIIDGFTDCCKMLEPYGINVVSTGGETADLGDGVRTIVVDSVLATRIKRSSVIDAGRIAAGNVIVGLSSTGRAVYEQTGNSGIGSNGLTLARHVLLSKHYQEKYPETAAPESDPTLTYRGKYKLSDALPDSKLTVGQALLSPTRTYAPVVKTLLTTLPGAVHGIIHNTGGGMGKCLRFGKNVHFIKDCLPPIPPIFRAVHDAGVPVAELASTFNLGCRLECYVDPSNAQTVIDIADRYGVEAKVIGRCESTTAGNRASIEVPGLGSVELSA